MSENDLFRVSHANASPTGGSVVLRRAEGGGCEVLLRALKARGLEPIVVHDEPDAMLAFATLAARGLSRQVLIVVEPTEWPKLDELVDAMRSHHPAAYRWRFDPHGRGGAMLSPLSDASHDHADDPSSATLSDGEPVGRLRRRTRPVDRLLVSPGRTLSTREVVTQQELTMLLGPAPGEAG